MKELSKINKNNKLKKINSSEITDALRDTEETKYIAVPENEFFGLYNAAHFSFGIIKAIRNNLNNIDRSGITAFMLDNAYNNSSKYINLAEKYLTTTKE